MGTRADFYVGRGANAEWLGSVAWDGYPDNDDYDLIFASAEERPFRLSVNELLGRRDDGTMPEHGWPWPWEDSTTTDWAYTFDGGEIYASYFGAPWVPVSQYLQFNDEQQEAYRDSAPADGGIEHPNMKAVQDVNFGRRSGVTIMGVSAQGLEVQDDKSELDERDFPEIQP